jgi:hypothetical protein
MTLLAAAGIAPPHARAWKYHEHRNVGAESYTRACMKLDYDVSQELAQAFGLRAACAKTDEKCNADAEHRIEKLQFAQLIVQELMCKDRVVMARTYGQSTALSGDHIGDPGAFVRIEGQRDTVSIIEYARRALRDGDHFHPRAPWMWQHYHLMALDLARQSSLNRDPHAKAIDEKLRRDFITMFYVNAFGDHFLQDSFAAGHMGFNRGASRPVAAMIHHDMANQRGRLVRNKLYPIEGAVGPVGRNEWWTHGDGQLHWPAVDPLDCEPQDQSGRDELLIAAAYSVYDALRAFALGESDPTCQQAARDRIPSEYFSTETNKWLSLAEMHNPAVLKFAASAEYRHVLGSHDIDRDQIAAVVSVPLDLFFGVRLDAAAAVIAPPLWASRPETVLNTRVGLMLPLLADYGSALSLDLGAGAVSDVCLQHCNRSDPQAPADSYGLVGGYLGPRLNIEAGAVLFLQFVVDGFLASSFHGQSVGGVSFGVAVGKGMRTRQARDFSGPIL